MNQKDKLQEAMIKALTGKLTESKNDTVHTYEVEYDESAVQRTPTPIQTDSFEGTRYELVNFLDSLGADCPYSDDEELASFDIWLKEYENYADYSGSAVILKITEDGKEIYKNSEYDSFMEEHENHINGNNSTFEVIECVSEDSDPLSYTVDINADKLINKNLEPVSWPRTNKEWDDILKNPTTDVIQTIREKYHKEFKYIRVIAISD